MLVVGEIVGEVAVQIAARDACIRKQACRRRLANAVTPCDARDTIDDDGLPRGVVANLASHRASLTPRVETLHLKLASEFQLTSNFAVSPSCLQCRRAAAARD